MKEKLKNIARLTASNNHTGARWYVADLYPYLSLFKRRFELIDKLSEIEGVMPFHLSQYRYDLTHEMLEIISEREGRKVLPMIYEAL